MRSALLVAVVAIPAIASAETWSEPTPAIVSSASGTYTLETTPRHPTQLLLRKQGHKVYERAVVNPIAASFYLVADSGHVITFNDHGRVGHDHAIVIYAPDGKLVIDRRLEELLTTVELVSLGWSQGSRWWIEREPTLSHDMVLFTGHRAP